MAWIMDTYSQQVGYSVPEVVTGKPIVLGGSHGRSEATGRGLCYMIHEAAEHLGLDLGASKAVVQGFGNVGSNAARFLAESGVRVIAVSDVSGGVYNDKGLAIGGVFDHLRQYPTLDGFAGGERISNEQLLELECDILAPAALQNQITADNAARIKCKILAEGANGPTTLEADEILDANGVFVIPDVLGNAGGVTVSYFEWVQDTQNFSWGSDEVNTRLHGLMVEAFKRTLLRSKSSGVNMRTAALMEGIERVAQAKVMRGIFP
jgi:glutamate dehydrogenase (NAD(P)+)